MPVSLDVTRRKLQLSHRDSVTGWYIANYVNSTIEMIVVSRAASTTLLPPGVYVRLDAVGLTQDVVEIGDQVNTTTGAHYEVKAVRLHYLGDSFWFRECDLTLLPFQYLAGKDYEASAVEDARYRTKVYLTRYLDGTALPHFIIAYGKPDYPMVQVFKTKCVDLVFSIGDPESTPMLKGDQTPYGYREQVPISIFCIDKNNLTGAKVKWAAEAELRRITEAHVIDSLRGMDRRRDNDQNLGTTILYSTEFTLNYRRDTT